MLFTNEVDKTPRVHREQKEESIGLDVSYGLESSFRERRNVGRHDGQCTKDNSPREHLRTLNFR